MDDSNHRRFFKKLVPKSAQVTLDCKIVEKNASPSANYCCRWTALKDFSVEPILEPHSMFPVRFVRKLSQIPLMNLNFRSSCYCGGVQLDLQKETQLSDLRYSLPYLLTLFIHTDMIERLFAIVSHVERLTQLPCTWSPIFRALSFIL